MIHLVEVLWHRWEYLASAIYYWAIFLLRPGRWWRCRWLHWEELLRDSLLGLSHQVGTVAELGLICLNRCCCSHWLFQIIAHLVVQSTNLIDCLLNKRAFLGHPVTERLLHCTWSAIGDKLALLHSNHFLFTHDHAIVIADSRYLEHPGTIYVDWADTLEYFRFPRQSTAPVDFPHQGFHRLYFLIFFEEGSICELRDIFNRHLAYQDAGVDARRFMDNILRLWLLVVWQMIKRWSLPSVGRHPLWFNDASCFGGVGEINLWHLDIYRVVLLLLEWEFIELSWWKLASLELLWIAHSSSARWLVVWWQRLKRGQSLTWAVHINDGGGQGRPLLLGWISLGNQLSKLCCRYRSFFWRIL